MRTILAAAPRAALPRVGSDCKNERGMGSMPMHDARAGMQP